MVDDVLDVGCGPGDNALYLAERGHRVTACERSPVRRRSGPGQGAPPRPGRGVAVADATRLDGWAPHRFRTVLDSASSTACPSGSTSSTPRPCTGCVRRVRGCTCCVGIRPRSGRRPSLLPSPGTNRPRARRLVAYPRCPARAPFHQRVHRQGLQHLLERQGRSVPTCAPSHSTARDGSCCRPGGSRPSGCRDRLLR